MPSVTLKSEPDSPPPGWTARILGWLTGSRARYVFGGVYGLAVVVTAVGVWLVASAPATGEAGAIVSASRPILIVLLFNLLLIVALAVAVGIRVLALVREQADDVGARLHLRFVTYFSAVAVVPAVLVAVVFGVLVNRGVEGWFSSNVRAAVENSADIGRGYVRDVSEEMENDLATMARELSAVRGIFQDRLRFGAALVGIGEFFGYPAIYVLDGDGQILARGEQSGAPPFLAPPANDLALAAAGEVVPVAATENPDVIRALYPLDDYGDAYLYVLKPLPEGTLLGLREGARAIASYREAEATRSQLQFTFLLAYFETALLVLVGAIWLGLSAASTISAPVGRLVKAAHRVASGDLTARVDSETDPGEIAVLSRAFNKMTEDLDAQQTALKAASTEAQNRSQFIETVLSGVSAGVIGLDRKGRVSAINDQAVRLLDLDDQGVVGQPIRKIAPELASLIHEGEGAEHDIDVSRESETRRLRVRTSGGAGGEVVLTFDDITRLMTAQRNAAWRDVARRIAHEIKNPLTPIQLSAERLRRKYRSQVEEDVETFDRCTDTIIRQVEDIGRMVDEFSSFARMPAPKFADEDAVELLREAVFARRVGSPDVVVELEEPGEAIRLICDGRMIGQALTNILKNGAESVMARKAIDPTSPGRLRASIEVSDDYVVYVVEDDGIGLPARDRDRLIEPYVTNREKGTGLGLAIVKRIAEEHGGELILADAVDLTGARVCLVFPRTIKPVPQTPDEAE
ncbi:sensor histidine kinase NtrY-like [Brevundimonas aveniformis]|uniref:sensor histidine kinase NtrY-like n=1 Tax=Brevundimonas aveniformis TaxID=370977 RepID=UPI002491E653|nr:PAS domain-containing sensor histidine kinase [Brevundimonas aveniformis]